MYKVRVFTVALLLVLVFNSCATKPITRSNYNENARPKDLTVIDYIVPGLPQLKNKEYLEAIGIYAYLGTLIAVQFDTTMPDDVRIGLAFNILPVYTYSIWDGIHSTKKMQEQWQAIYDRNQQIARDEEQRKIVAAEQEIQQNILIEKEKAAQESYRQYLLSLKSEGIPIILKKLPLFIDSVGGVDCTIQLTNISDAVIKYVTIEAIPYNAVDDPVSSEIGNKVDAAFKITGPINPFISGNYTVSDVWYNHTIVRYVITGVTVQFMDNSIARFTDRAAIEKMQTVPEL